MPDFDEKTADTLVRLKPSKYLRVNGKLQSGQLVAEKANGKIINKWVSPEFTLPFAIAKELADGNDPSIAIIGAATVTKKEVIEVPEAAKTVIEPDAKVNETLEVTETKEIKETIESVEPTKTVEITEKTIEKIVEKPSRGRPKKTE